MPSDSDYELVEMNEESASDESVSSEDEPAPKKRLSQISIKTFLSNPSPSNNEEAGNADETVNQHEGNIRHEEQLPVSSVSQKLTILNEKFYKCTPSKDDPVRITAQCKACLPTVTIIKGFSHSTSNFIRHYKRIHPSNFSEYEKMKDDRKTLQKRKFDRSSIDPKIRAIHDQNVVNFVIQGLHAFSIVEEPYFRKMFPNKTTMSRKKLVNRVCIEKQKFVAKMKEIISQRQYVSTAADIWSSRTRSFFGLTLHTINNNLCRENYVLACKRFFGRHTYDTIAEMFLQIYSEYGLNIEKIVTTVTDNGSNFVKSFKEFGISCELAPIERIIDEDDLVDEVEFIDFKSVLDKDQLYRLPSHNPCASHTLNLLATTDFKHVLTANPMLKDLHESFVKKANLLWNSMHRPGSAEKIKTILKCSLVYPVVHRWNSFLDSIIQLKSFDRGQLNSLFVALDKPESKFTGREFAYMDIYINVMKPIGKGIDSLQKEDDTFFGVYLPVLHSIYLKLQKTNDDGGVNDSKNLQKMLREGMLCKMEQRFSNELSLNIDKDSVRIALIASLSHPQYKHYWRRCSLATTQDLSYFKTLLLSAADEFITHDSSVASLETRPTSSSETSSTNSHSVLNFIEFDRPVDQPMDTAQSQLEINKFFEDESRHIQSLKNYPIISQVFMKYNAPLPSSASVERMFNYSNIVNKSRFNLSDENFENSVVLKCNKL